MTKSGVYLKIIIGFFGTFESILGSLCMLYFYKFSRGVYFPFAAPTVGDKE